MENKKTNISNARRNHINNETETKSKVRERGKYGVTRGTALKYGKDLKASTRRTMRVRGKGGQAWNARIPEAQKLRLRFGTCF